ncbi:MAG: hypothetical protein A2622_07250 [Bdellovibrionales bacterium RIFCSPHIGHO2_01_FULL_40_29]|nr:MAG: hypothetical protein A2622_07250 [Bdellovibrionales bacterium RIFCSPHIGHO2_01_FULL_40_29]OFZ33207.1 MAG: hypothetical protein A3D17_11530 [Bdellovibrionales bacterium RIFCSPHIGHO2_02_FULL_40_15]
MNKNRSDRRWILFILVLLSFEITWLLADLQWIDLPFLKRQTIQTGLVEAGHVMKANDNLKRRGANSLIWDSTQENDILYYKDSILTLSQSTAKLYLKDQTELQLAENTLVTLEEPDKNSNSEIRLRFSKGDLKARNPVSRTQIFGDDWVVNLEKGSEVALRKDKNSYEFEVIAGQARLETEKGSQILDQSKVLTLGNDQQVLSTLKNQNLQWSTKDFTRIYTFEESAKVPLKWQGSAQKISVQKTGATDSQIEISEQTRSTDVTLTPGNYKVRLVGVDGISDSKSIEVWPAPRIFLKKPLPRDRLPAGKALEFVWTHDQGIKKYKITFENGESIIRNELSGDNFGMFTFDKEQDIKWKVEGVDSDGVLIPSFYDLQLFIREQPLQAPKLKVPDIKNSENQKADGAFFKFQFIWSLFLKTAHAIETAASDDYEVSFEWESVPGADMYVLEVSSRADFQKPELIQILKSTQFTWKNVKYKKYFWRVAAGNSKGRMGFFSEAMELQLEALHKVQTASVPAKQEPLSVEVPKVVEKLNTEAPVAFAQQEPVEIPKKPWAYGIAWAPLYKVTQLEGERDSKLKLNGGSLQAAQLFIRTKTYGETYFQLSAQFSQQRWKPNPIEDYPFQKDLQTNESWIQIDYARLDQRHQFGLSAHESFYPIRNSQETIDIQSIKTVGPRYTYVKDSLYRTQQFTFSMGAFFGDQTQEVVMDFRNKFYFSNHDFGFKPYLGISGEFLYQKFQTGQGSQGNFHFLLGFDHF